MLLGDLFTTSCPSNTAVATSLNYLKKYALAGNDEKSLINFKTEGIANPEDPSLNRHPHQLNHMNANNKIDLPIFAIHGSKDQPDTQNKISPLEVIAQSNYLNYLGSKLTKAINRLQASKN